MVSVLEGRLARTWHYNDGQRDHVITLFHDTITGLRSAMCDFQEIPNSFGNSSLLMDSSGHRIFFTIEPENGASIPAYLEIRKEGWTSFRYRCIVRNIEINEVTQMVATDTSNIFASKVTGTIVTKDETSDGNYVVWYIIQTTRKQDNISTSNHRRFKDFADMFSQVKQNFKGHHLMSSLPPLPEKTLKITTDHMDPSFIADRKFRLNEFLKALLAVPHVAEMTCVKAFLGIMEQVKEFSVSFHVPTLGLSLITPERSSPDNPALVGLIQKPELCPGLYSGDAITKINGVPVAGMIFNGVVNRIKALPRPIIIHFVQVIARKSSIESEDRKSILTTTFPGDREMDISMGDDRDLSTISLYHDVPPKRIHDDFDSDPLSPNH